VLDTGLIPERTRDTAQALGLWKRAGAAILTVGRTDGEAVLEAAADMFGPHLIAHQGIGTVAANPKDGEPSFFDAATRTVRANAAEPLDLHIDGYMVFGERYPDVVLLLCERQAPAGGESFLVDGAHLVEAIAADPDQRDLHAFIWNRVINQTRTAGNGPPGTGAPVPHRAPIASRTEGGKVTVRYHAHQRLFDDPAAAPEDAALLARWHQVAAAAAHAAPRFLLQPGELLCLDNFRMFHGRQPYQGTDRVLHKLWAWSDMSFGVPDAEILVARGNGVQIVRPAR
jgi:gamma-butyrobetaine dioxygenase